MRRKRNRFKSDVMIDLTSLLDVIFIILLVVLCGQSSMKENLTQLQADAKGTQAQAEQEYKSICEDLEYGKYDWLCLYDCCTRSNSVHSL